MKKLTWALLSLMLFLGLGAAFAQAPSAPVLISPLDNATVEPGQPLDFKLNDDYSTQSICLLYTFDADASLDIDMATFGDIMNASVEGEPVDGVYGCTIINAAVGEGTVAPMLPTPMIPADVPSGKITLRVCAFNPDRQEASSITTATYTVGEATPVPAPTLPASAAVPMGTEITVVRPSV
ncbi:MAG: hypothetical protein K2H62_04620, partial [Bacteroidales bacterium]|nr:hypothetical protein [Bacteroidales bacterium]